MGSKVSLWSTLTIDVIRLGIQNTYILGKCIFEEIMNSAHCPFYLCTTTKVDWRGTYTISNMCVYNAKSNTNGNDDPARGLCKFKTEIDLDEFVSLQHSTLLYWLKYITQLPSFKNIVKLSFIHRKSRYSFKFTFVITSFSRFSSRVYNYSPWRISFHLVIKWLKLL